MGMFSDLARLAPKPKPKTEKSKLTVVENIETEVQEALNSGEYETVNIGLTTPEHKEPEVLIVEPSVETHVEEEVTSVDPLLNNLLDQVADQYSRVGMQEKLAILNGLNQIINNTKG